MAFRTSSEPRRVYDTGEHVLVAPLTSTLHEVVILFTRENWPVRGPDTVTIDIERSTDGLVWTRIGQLTTDGGDILDDSGQVIPAPPLRLLFPDRNEPGRVRVRLSTKQPITSQLTWEIKETPVDIRPAGETR